MACHMERWSESDREHEYQRIRKAVIEGNAWLWTEPQQGELFE